MTLPCFSLQVVVSNRILNSSASVSNMMTTWPLPPAPIISNVTNTSLVFSVTLESKHNVIESITVQVRKRRELERERERGGGGDIWIEGKREGGREGGKEGERGGGRENTESMYMYIHASIIAHQCIPV